MEKQTHENKAKIQSMEKQAQEVQAGNMAKMEEMEAKSEEIAEKVENVEAEATEAKAEARNTGENTGKIAGTVSILMAKTFIPLVVAICSRSLANELKPPGQRRYNRPQEHETKEDDNPHKVPGNSIWKYAKRYAEIHMPSRDTMRNWANRVSLLLSFSIIHSSLSPSSRVVACFKQWN
jgi:hypothetical protein